ncbi:MAG TPA: gamma-glutamylcyclotransferase family protein [Alphaproteobacteria bacterium]|nr:gamma-glutamylcyclotransferase family protein [Alphaproteobacteria bacterium]
MRLFFFGSLMDPDLFALVVGRPFDALSTGPGLLHGFQRRKVKGENYPILVPHPGGRVEGLLVEGLSAGEVDRLQFFEGGEYVLTPLPVTDAAGVPADAHAYVSTGILEDAGEPWRLEAWTATEKPRALAHSEELMALYGSITIAEMDALWEEIKERAERRFQAAMVKRASGR